MAIAYFIPDQAKLLAGQRPSNGSSNSSSRSSSNNNQPNSRLPASSAASATAPVINTTVNRGYGTTINISVPTFNNTTQEPQGCWDFLTQVFCHALRFYHESSQLQPTVIQISVNFNTQTATTTNTAAATTINSSPETPTAQTTSDSHTTEERKPRKLSKRKN